MTCARYRELISRYVDGEVTPRQRRDVLAHVEHCHDCAVWLARARQADVLLRGVPETHPSDRVRDAVLGSAAKKAAGAPPTRGAHLSTGTGLRLYTAGWLLRFDPSLQRIALACAVALFSVLGLAYWLNLLPPIWGYRQFCFLLPQEQAAALNTSTSTPISAISSGVNGVGGQMSVPNVLSVSPADGT